MGQINDHTDEIYEAMSDNDVDAVTEAIAQLMSICEDLQESITDGVSTKTNA
jgi:phage terminase Nu1 subunit (DNA packaging protein)